MTDKTPAPDQVQEGLAELNRLLDSETPLNGIPQRLAGGSLGVMDPLNKQSEAHYTEEDDTVLEILTTDAPTSLSLAAFEREVPIARQHGGPGSGLTVPKTMVGPHGDQIWVESIEGRGSKFPVLLPITSSSHA